MIADISIPYPQYFLILCILLGAIYATFLYYRDSKFAAQRSWLPYVMSMARGTVVSGIAILLLAPLLRSIIENEEKPLVVIAQDVSQSARQADVAPVDMTALRQQLSESYEVVDLAFGDEVRVGLPDSLVQQSTDLGNVLSYISDNYADQNLGAVILSSDGIYNQGRDPRYLVGGLQTPVYTIALGDTTKRRDLLVKDVYHNKIAYLGDQFELQIDIKALNAGGSGSVVTVQRIADGKATIVGRKPVSISGEEYFETIEMTLDADRSGVAQYRIAVAPIKDEINNVNNTKDIYIEVLDSRQKVLLLAHAPHPDLAAIKSIVTSNKNYEVDIAQAQESIEDLSTYSLIIYHNLPSKKYTAADIRRKASAAKIPALYVVGAQTELSALNQAQDVVRVTGGGSSLEDIQAQLRTAFSGYILDQDLLPKLSNYPPLVAPFGTYQSSGPADVVMTQRIKKIGTDYPMLSYGDKGGVKTGVLTGEGIWRWRLFNFLQDGDYAVVNEFTNKMVQYLVVKDDKRKFRISLPKNVFKENESVLIDGQLYNDSYELINDPDVSLKIVDAEGNDYRYTMSRNSKYYRLDAGFFKPGSYRYEATTTNGGKTLKQSGRFSVREVQLELYDLTARHDILAQLAENSGAVMYYPDSLQALSTQLMTTNRLKPVIYQSTTTRSALDLKWIFAVLLSLLVLEWFLRRYFGYY